MQVNKRITYFLITGLFVFSILHTSMMVKADLPFVQNTNWKWAVNPGDHLIYLVEDNVLGSRYQAFNVSGNPWSAYGFLDVLNLTRFKYNPNTYLVEETNALFQCAASLTPGFWQLSFYDELGQNTGDFIFAFPLVPVDAVTGNLALNTWAGAMTSNVYGGTSYAGSLNLTEYHVVGNEIQLYNSTTGHYVNMTYDNNGHLLFAKISVVLDMGGPTNVIQTITSYSGSLDVLNPIDSTELSVEENDLLIYEQKIMGMDSYFIGYNITWKGITTEPYPGGVQVFIGANATHYHWNPYINDWMIEEDEWDEEEQQWHYAFIDQSIGGGNDFYQFRRMDGPFSYVYPVGTNGTHLYNNYGAIYAHPQNGGLDQYIVTEWSLKLYNAAGDYFYLEMNGSDGILKNGTFSVGGMVYTNYLSTVADLPEPIGSDEVLWHTNVGAVKYYEILTYFDETPYHYYQKAVINNIYSGIVAVDMYGTLIPMDVSIVNATLYQLNEGTNEWIEVPIDEENPNYEGENIWGMGNNQGPIQIGGEPARLYQDGINGDIIYGIFYPYGVFWGMDYYSHSPSYFEMNNGSSSGDDIYLVIELDPATGWVSHQNLRLPNEAPGPEEPEFHQIERWLIDETDLPYNELPSAPQTLNAIAGNAVVDLTWIAPADEGGSALTGYTIYRATSETGTYVQIGTTSSAVLTFTDTNVVNGNTYYYKVSANNTAGEGLLTEAESATPRTVPSAPQTLSATAGNTVVTLTWTAPVNDGGSAVTGYSIYRATSETGIYTRIGTTINTLLTFSDTDVANGLTYYYKVSANNTAGEGALAEAENATPRTVPSTPQALSATAGDTVVTLTWTAPANDGGSAITGYTIYRATSEAGTYAQIGTTINTVLIFNDTDVVNGITYYYKVSANNAVGEGALTEAEVATPETPEETSSTTSDTSETTPFNISGYGIPLFFLTCMISIAILITRRKTA